MTSVALEEMMRRVPAPNFSTEPKSVEPARLISVLPRTMSPLATNRSALLPTVFWMPPKMRRVEVASAPMTAP